MNKYLEKIAEQLEKSATKEEDQNRGYRGRPGYMMHGLGGSFLGGMAGTGAGALVGLATKGKVKAKDVAKVEGAATHSEGKRISDSIMKMDSDFRENMHVLEHTNKGGMVGGLAGTSAGLGVAHKKNRQYDAALADPSRKKEMAKGMAMGGPQSKLGRGLAGAALGSYGGPLGVVGGAAIGVAEAARSNNERAAVIRRNHE